MIPAKIIASAQAINTGEMYRTTLTANAHTILSDEPTNLGGKDEGPAPPDLLCMSLASCTVITLRMYAQRKNWHVDTIKVTVKMVKGSEMESGNNTFYSELELTGNLTEEERARMHQISKACPVHKLLSSPSDIVSVLCKEN